MKKLGCFGFVLAFTANLAWIALLAWGLYDLVNWVISK